MSRIVNPRSHEMRNAAAAILISALLVPACSQSYSVTTRLPDTADDPIVAVVDGTQILMSEFEEQYNRSAGMSSEPVVDSLADYQDFLERYVDFKIKVLEARVAGYHELDDLVEEIHTYRDQLARPYLLQQEVTDPLIEEMYDRRMEVVEASHILLRVDLNASPEDTLAAYTLMSSLLDSLRLGSDFGDLAFMHSQDPSASRVEGTRGYRGYLGSFGGGKMVKPFEDAAYETSPGEVSPIIRTQFGYHILQVHSKRPMPEGIRIAHIMIQQRGLSAADSAAALLRLQEIHDRLARGDDFGEVAKELSDDRTSAPQGGLLQDLAYDAGLPVEIRDAAYNLEPGGISDAIHSQYGYHLIKLIEFIPNPSYEESYEDLRAQVAGLPRSKAAETRFAVLTRMELGQSVDSALVENWATTMAPDSLFRALAGNGFDEATLSVPIATLGDSTYSVRQLTSFLSSVASPRTRDRLSFVWASVDLFLNQAAINYRIEELEDNDADFSETMHEFREGLILFRLMEDSVWTAASIDSTGLESFYNEHADAYRFGDRTRVIGVTSTSDSLLQVLVDGVRGGQTLEDGIAHSLLDTTSAVRVDTTMIEGTTNSVFDQILDSDPGEVSDPVSYNRGFIVLYNNGTESARQKTFEEARSQALNGYQEILEKRLLSRLRKKFAVEVYPDRLDAAFSGTGASNPASRGQLSR